jgi:putative nucleotidyltransferase with HDIG domain
MNPLTKELEKQYTGVLKEYLAGAQEVALARAYEYGRQAVTDGLGLMEITSIHHRVFEDLIRRAATPQRRTTVATAASAVFAEIMAPFEMVHRGFRDANDTLRKLNETLERQVAERTEEIQRQLNRLTALRTIDTAITGSLDLRVTLDIFLNQLMAQLGGDAADVLILQPSTRALEFSSGRGFRGQAVERTRLRIGEGLAGRVALDRQVVAISNLAQEGEPFTRWAALAEEGFLAYHAAPLVAKGAVTGVVEVFHRRPFAAPPDWLEFLEALAGQAAIAIDNATLFSGLQRANLDLTLAYDTTLEGWSNALDLRDRETEGHTQRVTELTLRLARAMGLRDEDLLHVRRGALLHDIGKMAIPDSILLKPGPLTDEEWVIMRKHPVYAFELLAPIAYLRPALDIPYSHHEKWDGTGYPRGLKEDQIPQAARIFAVADVWDALRSDRPYRPAWPRERAQAHIREQVGRHFEPAVADVFFQLIASEPD